MLCAVRDTFGHLAENHYLGPTKTASFGWHDQFGVMVFGNPRGRNIPNDWLELVRWCTAGYPNAGSQGWANFSEWARCGLGATTIISYSDPSQGHTGSLYRACNWLWAPTWHRLRPPPSGNGSWSEGKRQEVKDRWVYPVRPDVRRAAVLTIKDDSVLAAMPWANYREPKWRKDRFDPRTGGGNYQQFQTQGDRA